MIAKLQEDEPVPDPDPDVGESSSYWTELYHAWGRLGQIHSQYYEHKAKLAAVPLPNRAEKAMYDRIEWDYDIPLEPIYYLSSHGIKYVRGQLWEANKQNRERITYWLSIFFGVVGALTGLISVWKG